MDEIVVGIDVGTTKVCTLVGRVEEDDSIRIIGVGIEPSDGIKKGAIVDLGAASEAITRSVERAEHTSGVEIAAALVSLASANVASVNSRGKVGVNGGVVDEYDVVRAIEDARTIAIPSDREMIHVIERGFVVDGQDGIRTPIGMHGYRLEVETHIITALAASVDNLRECVAASGVDAAQFVLNPLASAEVVLQDTDRQMGCIVCDIGGGTTDLAIYVDGDVWHTMVLAVGGNHITADIAHGLRLPMTQAEEIKKKYGHAIRSEVGMEEYFTIQPFGEDEPVQINRQELAHIIEARVEEIFSLAIQEIKRSGYDGLLPAGMILTGGSSALPGMRKLASKVMGMPVRTAKPEGLVGLVDQLDSPAYSTSVGLLHWALSMQEHNLAPARRSRRQKGERNIDLDGIKNFFKRLIP